MDLVASIKLRPSFHDTHSWSVEVLGARGKVTGKCAGELCTWQLSEFDMAALPSEVRSGWFPDDDYDQIGCDGIGVDFSITTDEINREKRIWCPEQSLCPEYSVLLRWCWSGLYENSSGEYRRRLEELFSYFNDWGVPVRRTNSGLKIFGMLCSGQESELKRYFDEVTALPAPEIDMSNFENTGTFLYPWFKRFFQNSPDSKWRVNARARSQMKQAGIPEESMILTEGT